MLSFLLSLTLLTTFPGNYTQLNKQAIKEYQTPIRPGYEGRNPFWNGYAKKFMYAPAFDFQEVPNAAQYLFTITAVETTEDNSVRGDDDSETKKEVELQIKRELKSWSFKAKSPKANLAPVWDKVTPGQVVLRVEALDKKGQVISKVGERKFMRDYPFQGPYFQAIRPYREAARMALLYIHQMPAVQNWKESLEPDMSYKHYTYVNKIISATVRAEVQVAKSFPQYREEAIQIAKNAAQFLINESRPAGEKLAYFPPTYRGDFIASKRNKGLTMTMDACMAGTAFMDLYDLTKEEQYMDRALKIADTYAKLQREDGSIPVKVKFETGEPVQPRGALLTALMSYIRRLQNQYNNHNYDKVLAKAEQWMQNEIMKSFDLTGQFEDVSVDVQPYQNLTNCTASAYASYLLSESKPNAKAIQDAKDLLRLSEDQFVYWETPIKPTGVRRLLGPCVFEQYHYPTPVDNSSCNVANGLMSLYEVTGDKLALAKAIALMNTLTVVQNHQNGCAVTTFDYRETKKDKGRTFWMNCSLATINTWIRLADILGEK